MEIAQNLAAFILVSQGIASFLLVLGALFDSDTIKKHKGNGHFAIPHLRKTIRLFRNTRKPIMMSVYFLCAAFILFSYAAFMLLVVHLLSSVIL